MNSYDFSNVEVIEGHSITEEAFENFGNESLQENISLEKCLDQYNPMCLNKRIHIMMFLSCELILD